MILTEFELKTEVSKFYKGYLSTDKAVKLYELEYGIRPKIKENKKSFVSYNYKDLPKYKDFITEESLIFMKQLQESGAVNMFQCIPNIQQNLFFDRHEAKDLLLFYMENYTALYYPQNLI